MSIGLPEVVYISNAAFNAKSVHKDSFCDYFYIINALEKKAKLEQKKI
jgi:hypothetical protein